MDKKNIVVSGAAGRMGKTICKMIIKEDNYSLAAAIDVLNINKDIFNLLGINSSRQVLIKKDLKNVIENVTVDLVIDFTNPEVVMKNIETVLAKKVKMIVGTTGFDQSDLKKVKKMSEKYEVPIMIAPNFALGAVLMMEFSKKAAKFFEQSEIIELHHDKKIDAPSGTAVKTAEMISESRSKNNKERDQDFLEKLKGARGADYEGVHVHSVRLQGLVAHQEVIFGGEGQTLKIRHDSINRESFMPGIKLAIDKIDNLEGLIYGLEKIMDI